MPAVEAHYHQKCSINFRTGRSFPIQYRPIQTQTYKRGIPSSRNADTAFQHVMEYLEERVNDKVTISDPVHQMQELYGEEAYSTPITESGKIAVIKTAAKLNMKNRHFSKEIYSSSDEIMTIENNKNMYHQI
ncbi:hypothetical protein MAR_010623 [Mya arenaria]|uniref:Uncharacterized protein n=1 Tax=Mya arenaria TaxID=6604 RepID=A0ABY7E2J9_MYAAR|nr:hypothetical protein MAR_010623 [Mya arenaria]